MIKMNISLRADQVQAIKELADLSSTSPADVIRQLIDKNQEDIVEAIEIWRTYGGVLNPRGNKARKSGKLGFNSL